MGSTKTQHTKTKKPWISTGLYLDHLSLRRSGLSSFWFGNLGRSSLVNLLRYEGFCIEAPARTRATSFDSSSSLFLDSSISKHIESKDRAITLPLGLWVCLFFCFCFSELGELVAPFLFFSLSYFREVGWERISSSHRPDTKRVFLSLNSALVRHLCGMNSVSCGSTRASLMAGRDEEAPFFHDTVLEVLAIDKQRKRGLR